MLYINVASVLLRNISPFVAATVCLTDVQFGQISNLQTQNLSFMLVRVALSAKRFGDGGPRCGDAIVVNDKTVTFGGFSRLIIYRESSPLPIVINFTIANRSLHLAYP